jgi:hypothetical protein
MVYLKLTIIFAEIIAEHAPGVFLVVAIYAEVLPVGTVGRVVVMVPVFMVDSQEVPVFVIKLPRALRADEAMNFERLFPVIIF